MKVYVLTEIDLVNVGHSPKTVPLFPTLEGAVKEMKRMYEKALKGLGAPGEHKLEVSDNGGYAYIWGGDYRLDIYECVLNDCEPLQNLQEITVCAEAMGVRSKLMLERNMSRADVWSLMQKWAEEYEERYKDYDYCGNSTSVYDEIDAFVLEKAKGLDKPDVELNTDPTTETIEFCDRAIFGTDAAIFVRLRIFDGYAEGNGVRVEYPKLADLTREQIDEMDEYLGGRINDSGFVCPEDVILKYGKVVSFTGIMDTTNGHSPDLVKKLNLAWVEKKDNFRLILCSLYDRDLTLIYHSDSFSGLPDNMDAALATLQTGWDIYAGNYLQHIADDLDLESVLAFVR